MRARAVAAMISLLAAAMLASPGASAAFAAGSPFANPASNLPTPNGLSGAGSPCTPSGGDRWAACNNILLAAINAAQVKEHRRGFTLPTNFLKLSPAQQLFVWVNLERISRGVPPLVGLSPYLSAAAAAGAKEGRGPKFETSYGPVEVAANVADGEYEWSAFEGGGSSMPMAGGLVFALMYQDGWGGPSFGPFGQTMNYACKSPKAAGCWQDRDDLLGLTTGTTCTDCIAGAGSAPTFFHSYALLIVHPTEPTTPLNFTWDGNVLPYLPHGYERASAPSAR